jgi:hypothetical protein
MSAERRNNAREDAMFNSSYNHDDSESYCHKSPQEEAHLEEIRDVMAKLGYSIMHRRNGEYWIMSNTPKTLAQIEAWIERQAVSI